MNDQEVPALIPPVRTASAITVEVTEFVGRKTEVAEVCRSVTGARLVTIVGTGGVGKTRLAFRAAQQSAGHFPDGVHFAELSDLMDPRLLPDMVAASLGLARQESKQPFDAVLDHLRPRRLLLVLDTCEHLVDECAMLVEAILREALEVTILATSRQALDVVGERTYQLAPLPLPPAAEKPGGGMAPGSEPPALADAGDAAELFVQRATAADPAFTVTSANWADIVRVIRRLDGIPLAIELAAVRLRALPVSELAERLDRRFDMLASRRVGTPRHQTLRTAIEWSHDLCTEPEQTLWARLSVFAGTFDIAAAEQVCSGPDLPPGDVLPTLLALVEKSVVVMDGGRYRLLDTIREFGAAQLAESGQESHCRSRYVIRYVNAARDFGWHFLDHDQDSRLRAMRTEHGNLRAAMQYGLTSGDPATVRNAAEVAISLYAYWAMAGVPREGRYWIGLALDQLPAGPSPERAWALITLGYLGTYGGEPAKAVTETSDGIRMALDLEDDGLLLARAYLYQHIALMFDGQHDAAFAIEQKARHQIEAVGDRTGLILLDQQMGHLYQLAGRLDEAIESSERCLRMLSEGNQAGETGEQWVQSYCLMVIALALLLMGRDDEAVPRFFTSLPMSVNRGDDVGCAYALEGLGWLAERAQRANRSAWLLGGANACWERVGARLANNAILEAFHQDLVASVRRRLGDERFDALFAQGHALLLQDLINQAVSDADHLGTPDQDAAAQPPARLTRREREIAALVASGMSNREIGEQLFISKRTVDSHVEHIYAKLGVTSRVQLTVQLANRG